VDGYEMSEEQADHVVRMQLGSLTSLEQGEIEDEYAELQERIERLEEILENESELLGVIKDELREIKEEYDDERRTRIEDDAGEVTDEDLIPERDVLVVLTRDGYAKRMRLDEFEAQRRGGKGIIGGDPKEGDTISKIFVANTHDYVLCFTDRGRVHRIKTYELPEMGRTARGRSVVNLLNLEDGEEVTAVVNTNDFSEDECFLMVTRDGMVNRTCAKEFDNILSTGINAIKLNEGDELVDVIVTGGDADIVIGTQNGYAIRFDESEVPKTSRDTKGVNGVKLREDDAVVGVDFVEDPEEATLLTVTENGYGKRTPLDEYSKQSRYGYGNIDIKTGERNGDVVSLTSARDDDGLVVMSAEGKIMRTNADEIKRQGRNTMGVIIMRLEDGDSVATVTPVKGGVNDDDEVEDADGE
ncbi:MAG: DNA gyrase C-terminal beta-propeller domain-containing protein, partial [Halobacteria archaeon]|nr:DNA gyrase C-terminal beta-propeller domain-containing protein [Halobacteria archaeon]